jgi:hypothetical protein
MQRIVGLLLILWGAGWLASEMPAEPDQQKHAPIPWRHTSDGWERANWLWRNVPHPQPTLHPVVVGALLALFASAALIGLSPEQRDAANVPSSSTDPVSPPPLRSPP